MIDISSVTSALHSGGYTQVTIDGLEKPIRSLNGISLLYTRKLFDPENDRIHFRTKSGDKLPEEQLIYISSMLNNEIQRRYQDDIELENIHIDHSLANIVASEAGSLDFAKGSFLEIPGESQDITLRLSSDNQRLQISIDAIPFNHRMEQLHFPIGTPHLSELVLNTDQLRDRGVSFIATTFCDRNLVPSDFAVQVTRVQKPSWEAPAISTTIKDKTFAMPYVIDIRKFRAFIVDGPLHLWHAPFYLMQKPGLVTDLQKTMVRLRTNLSAGEILKYLATAAGSLQPDPDKASRVYSVDNFDIEDVMSFIH